MPVENLLERQELLKASDVDIALLLEEKFHISALELSQIRSIQCLEDRIIAAASIITGKLRQSSAENISSSITSYTLSAVLHGSSENLLLKSISLGKKLNSMYHDEKLRLKAEHDLDAPPIHFLRVEVGAYSGNLVSAKREYRFLKPSAADWQTSVCLPINLGKSQSFLLGVIYADACIDRNTVRLNGTQSDSILYATIVKPLVKKIFNKNPSVLEEKNGDSSIHYVINISSSAVKQWVEYLGFPSSLEKVKGETQKLYFVAGYIAAKGQLQPERAIGINESVGDTIDVFASCLDSLGIAYSRSDRGVFLTNESTMQLFSKELIINPLHYEELSRRNYHSARNRLLQSNVRKRR